MPCKDNGFYGNPKIPGTLSCSIAIQTSETPKPRLLPARHVPILKFSSKTPCILCQITIPLHFNFHSSGSTARCRTSPDGGIGRRVGLKHQCPKGCAGSTPAPGTCKRGNCLTIKQLPLLLFFKCSQIVPRESSQLNAMLNFPYLSKTIHTTKHPSLQAKFFIYILVLSIIDNLKHSLGTHSNEP